MVRQSTCNPIFFMNVNSEVRYRPQITHKYTNIFQFFLITRIHKLYINIIVNNVAVSWVAKEMYKYYVCSYVISLGQKAIKSNCQNMFPSMVTCYNRTVIYFIFIEV